MAERRRQSDPITDLPLSLVYPNPDQPRKDFDPDRLEELAMSIREYGVLEPIVVTPRGDRYMIIAGERRYRASLLAGLHTIPARVIEADDALVEELALLENIQRQDLNIIEEARAYRALLSRGWSREDLARKMGFKQPWRIDERTSLLNLTPEHQALVAKGVIGNSQAFEMSRLSPGKQAVVLKKVLSGELSSYNKLRSFVDALVALERQDSIFELQSVSDDERRSIDSFNAMLSSVERFIRDVHEQGKTEHMKKAGFRRDVQVERLDLVIASLMKIRKTVLAGQGIKEAMQEVVL